MKKILVYSIVVMMALCAKVCLASGESVIYTQGFEHFTESADGSAAPNGLNVLNCQGVQGGSGVYSADEVYEGSAVIKTNVDCGNTALVYTFSDAESGSFIFEASVLIDGTNTERTLTVYNGDNFADIVTFGNNGYVYAGESRVYGLKLQTEVWYKIKAAYTPNDGKVTLKVMYDGVEYISQGIVPITGSKVTAVGIRVPSAVYSATFIDNIKLMYSNEYDRLLYADNFENYQYSAVLQSSRWNKIKLDYTSDASSEYGTNIKTTKTVSNDANIETIMYDTTNVHYTGTDDIHYNISLKFEDFNSQRHITVRDYSDSSSYKYARPLGYIDQSGYLHWDGMKQDYKFEKNLWYDIELIYNRVTGNAVLTVSDALNTFRFVGEDVCKIDSVTRIGIELKGLTSTSSVMYIDNVSLWLKSSGLSETGQKTNWYEKELNTLDSIKDLDTNGSAVITNGSSMVELSRGEYINYTSETNDAQVFVVDVYITAPVSLSVKGDGEEFVSFTDDFKIKSGAVTLGGYSANKTYRIFITNNSGTDKRYIAVSEGAGRLIGFTTSNEKFDSDFRIQNSLNKVFINNIGFAQSGKQVSPISISPDNRTETSVTFAEIVFPTYIDPQSVSVFVNGTAVEAKFMGDKTVRVENLQKNSYYHITITNATDVLGNVLNADMEFCTGNILADVKFPLRSIKTGHNPIKLTIK